MHLFRIWFQRLPDIRNFAVYFLALWPMFHLIPTLRENSCAKPVLRANLWVKFRYSGIGFFGVWNLFLGIRNEITWSAPEHIFSHYFRTRKQLKQEKLTYQLNNSGLFPKWIDFSLNIEQLN